MEAADPNEERLKPLSKDSRKAIIKINIASSNWPYSWTIKVIGDTLITKDEWKKQANNPAIIVIRSLVWPGAYIIYQNERWFNFYTGFGHKNDECSYYPIYPPVLQTEPEDAPVFPEPNPRENVEAKPSGDNSKDTLARLGELMQNQEALGTVFNNAFDALDEAQSGQIEKGKLDAFIKLVTKGMGISIEPEKEAVEGFFAQSGKDQEGAITKEELSKPFGAFLENWGQLLADKLEKAPQAS